MDRWTRIVAVVLLVVVFGFGTFYVKEQYFSKGEMLIARDVARLESRVQADPENLDARLSMGQTYLASKRYQDAIAQFREVLKLKEDNIAAFLGLGRAFVANKQDDKALEQFEHVIALLKDAKYSDSDKRLNVSYFEAGRIVLARGDLDKAYSYLVEALKIERTDADAWFLLGKTLRAKGLFSDSAAAYTTAVTFVPNWKDAYLALAELYDETGEAYKAKYARAMILLTTGQQNEAVRQLEVVVERLPDFVDSAYGLAMACDDKGDKKRALEYYRKTVELAPGHKPASQRMKALEELLREQ